MPRGCGCAGNSCGCLVQPGPGVNVTGTGNASDPYIVSLQETSPVTLGPFTVPGANADLTNVVDGNAVVIVDYEADVFFKFSENAIIGTQVNVRLQPSFGAELTFVGNVWLPVGTAEPLAPPASGNWWLRAVKMDAFNWFVDVVNVGF
jgi:hypothetical protein